VRWKGVGSTKGGSTEDDMSVVWAWAFLRLSDLASNAESYVSKRGFFKRPNPNGGGSLKKRDREASDCEPIAKLTNHQ